MTEQDKIDHLMGLLKQSYFAMVSLMGEVGGKKATDWALVNEALCDTEQVFRLENRGAELQKEGE